MRPHPGRALHEGFYNYGCQLGMLPGEGVFGFYLGRGQRLLGRHAADKAKHMRRGQPDGVCQKGSIKMMKEFGVTHADRAQGIAVVGFD